ncbi:uncharacterized protein LOC110675578 [Aedes aegypti]|uniref:Uncharacterized protein n=1 Tax=Aedes aegypti TaxID=7159 RepID=A0A6I8TYT4_AEDAE|nr:uncharacterized protein LOC110675578 [Aedes aegypti]
MPIWRSNRKNLYVMWHYGKWHQKILFLAKPFLQDILFVWLDVWSAKPLPALVKLALSVVIITIMLLPIAYALCGILVYLGFWQHQIDSLYPTVFPVKLHSLYWMRQICKRTVYSDAQVEFFQRKVHGFMLITAGMVDYMRLLFEIV